MCSGALGLPRQDFPAPLRHQSLHIVPPSSPAPSSLTVLGVRLVGVQRPPGPWEGQQGLCRFASPPPAGTWEACECFCSRTDGQPCGGCAARGASGSADRHPLCGLSCVSPAGTRGRFVGRTPSSDPTCTRSAGAGLLRMTPQGLPLPPLPLQTYSVLQDPQDFSITCSGRLSHPQTRPGRLIPLFVHSFTTLKCWVSCTRQDTPKTKQNSSNLFIKIVWS